MQKFCIVCGNENFSRSKKFCCEKCQQKYYYEQHKKELRQKHYEHYIENKEKYNENSREWHKENKEKSKEIYDKWRKDNKDRFNQLVRLSYARRKEISQKDG